MPVHGRALSTPRPAPDYFAPTTGEKLHGNGGQHVFPLLRDGADADRTIEAQCNGICCRILCCRSMIWNLPAARSPTSCAIRRVCRRHLGRSDRGVDYGKCVAKVMQRRDGSLWIYSFAQGRTVYDLRCDAAAVRRLVEAVGKEDVVEAFVVAAAVADLNAIEETELRDLAVKRSGVGKRALTNAQKARERVQAQVRQAQEQRRREAERSDPRPRIFNPDEDAPWLKTMGVINSVLEELKDRNPPARDVDGDGSAVRKLRVPGTYAPTADERPSKRMPAPEQWIFKKMSEAETAELIERHIDFVDPNRRLVHLRPAFVRHYMNRHDGVLPVQVAIATAPIILPDGTLLAPVGLDRARGIVFEI